jgi:hypothetical protein
MNNGSSSSVAELATGSPWQPETPFALDQRSMTAVDFHSPSPTAGETPFVDEYFTDEGIIGLGPERMEFASLLEELYEEEFDDLLYQIAEEAAAVYGDIAVTQGEVEASGLDPERFLQQYLAPLQSEAERMLDRIAEVVGERDLLVMGDAELDGLLDSLELGETSTSPLFEEFFGSWVNKIKKVVKKAVSVAKKVASKFLPINAILGKLKKLVRPLIQRVLKFALNKLPPQLRPIASQLAKRFLGEAPDVAGEVTATLATADIGAVQQEFDMAMASLAFVTDPIESEIALGETMTEPTDDASIARLQQAREAFVREIADLPPGADPAPAVERFLPAILPFVRMGISIIGRPRVVKFLAGFVAKLIARFVGREPASALSLAIVDAGLRLLSLEAPAEGDAGIGATALAATVEDTVRRLAELDEAYLDDDALLEAAAYDAFEAAASANLPPALLKPSLRPTARIDGTWVMLPLHGPKLYKKFTRPLTVRITPQLARRLETYDGATLDTFLLDRFGLEGEVDATAHLYEALPGTRPALIARSESGVAGLGSASPHAWSSLHPLTEEGAALLFGEPGLGGPTPETTDGSPTLEVGERLFFLEVRGSPPAPTMPGGRATLRHATQARVRVDTTTGELAVHIYLSEPDAQRIASQTPQGPNAAQVAAQIVRAADGTLDAVIEGRYPRRIRVVLGQGPRDRRTVIRRLRALAPRLRPLRLGKTVATWLHRALTVSASLPGDIAKAAADGKDGVTVIARLRGVGGLDALGRLLKTPIRAVPPNATISKFSEPKDSSVRVVAGFEW